MNETTPVVIELQVHKPLPGSHAPLSEHMEFSRIVGEDTNVTVFAVAKTTQRAPAACPTVDANVTVALVPASDWATPVMLTASPKLPPLTDVCDRRAPRVSHCDATGAHTSYGCK